MKLYYRSFHFFYALPPASAPAYPISLTFDLPELCIGIHTGKHGYDNHNHNVKITPRGGKDIKNHTC